MKRKIYPTRIRFLLLICLCGILAMILTYAHLTVNNSFDVSLTKVNVKDELLINTTGCKIEYIPPWSSVARKYFTTMARPDCSKKQKIINFSWVEDEYLKISQSNLKALIKDGVVCSYRQISRKPDTDFGYNLGKEIIIDLVKESSIALGKIEFLQVICKKKNNLIYENYHTNVFWKKGKTSFNNSQNLYNVLFVGIDSTSRNNLIRYMPKVYDYLLNELNGVDLQGFIKVAGYTLGNVGVMLRGKWVQEWKGFSSQPFLDKYHFIFQDYADKGYMTLFGEDDSDFSMFKSAVKGFKKQPTDYWSLPFSDAATTGKLSRYLCFGQKTNVQSLTDWFLQYQNVYKSQPWWAHIHQALGVHGKIDALGPLENDYLNFLKEVKNRNIFNNSFLFFYADHGLRYGKFRQTYVGRYEEHLPFMIIVPPKDFIERHPTYYENIRSNAKKLSTYFDIHKTLHHILNLNNELSYFEKHGRKRGESLFNTIPDERTCASAPLRQRDCMCKTQMKMSTNNNFVKSATSFAVSEMKALVKKHDQHSKCAKISLLKTTEAFALLKSLKDDAPLTLNDLRLHSDSSYAKIILTFIIKPSMGIFEALIGYSFDSKTYTLLENFERLDSYGNQSDCISPRELKGICYCTS